MIRRQLKIELKNETVNSFIQKANEFDSAIKVIKHSKIVDGKDSSSMRAIQLECGNIITLVAEGGDEREAIEALSSVLKGEPSINSF
ncbi:HPr family phosphocarrier protein [Sutcliffiella cohnii]